MAIVEIGTERHIDDMILFNDERDEEEEGPMEDSQKALLMQKIHPEKYQRITENLLDSQSPGMDELGMTEDMMLQMEAGDMGQKPEVESTGSFLDMEEPASGGEEIFEEGEE
jgi:hypothetical protein